MLKKTLTVRVGKRVHVLPIRDILYMEKRMRKVCVHTTEGDYLYYARFDEVVKNLDVRFVWFHRSYILNMDRIRSIGDAAVIMDDGSELFFSEQLLLRLKRHYTGFEEWKQKWIAERNRENGRHHRTTDWKSGAAGLDWA